MPQALNSFEPSLAADELAWLATQADVESRIVFTHVDGGSTHYEVVDGPFDDSYFSSLPPRNWSLLVQDVEKHLPDFRALFAAVDFIPDWRIDDLMVSYAVPGGGVGPHTDNYDVFLCQGVGEREWRLGTGDDCRPDASAKGLSLLLPFDDSRPMVARDGDVLYLPPGVPHWGIANDFCMTWSIGMRAPNLAELKLGMDRVLADDRFHTPEPSPGDSEKFFTDPDLRVDEAEPGLISPAAVSRARDLVKNVEPTDADAMAAVLGCVVTDTKAWLAPESADDGEAKRIMDSIAPHRVLSVHGMARLAYCSVGRSARVFANGHCREVGESGLELYRRICRQRSVTPAQIGAAGDPGLLQWLLTRGVVDLTETGG